MQAGYLIKLGRRRSKLTLACLPDCKRLHVVLGWARWGPVMGREDLWVEWS